MLCKKKTISLFCVSTCLGVHEAVCCSSLAIMCVSPLYLLPVALYVRKHGELGNSSRQMQMRWRRRLYRLSRTKCSR